MMSRKVLVVGNSQAGRLKLAHDANQSYLQQLGDVSFLAIPGGRGPHIGIEDDGEMKMLSWLEDHPPRIFPPSNFSYNIHEYDIVIVSALGLIIGGLDYVELFQIGALMEYDPVMSHPFASTIVSDHCFETAFRNLLDTQDGIVFLRTLASKFHGKILLQRMPYPPLREYIERKMRLFQVYRDPLGFHEMVYAFRDKYFEDLCEENNIGLLQYPVSCDTGKLTPDEYMGEDSYHPNEVYAEMILKQINQQLL